MTHEGPLPVWQLQEGEPTKAFKHFCVYRDLGPARSLSKARQACGDDTVSLRWLEQESSDYHWVERVRAYDRHLDNARTAEVLEQWQQSSQAAARLVWEVLTRFADNPGAITSHDLPHLLREASKLCFLLSGTPTERLKQDVEAIRQDDTQQANTAFLALFEHLTGSAGPGDADSRS